MDTNMGSRYKILMPSKYDSEVAYLDALVRGDGTLVRNGCKIEISDKAIEMHTAVIKPLFRKVFDIDMHIRKKGNGWTSSVKSVNLFGYLSKILGIPVGEKAHLVEIPKAVFDSEINTMKGHIRGWMDAEGSVKFKQNKNVTTPRFSFGCKSRAVRDDLVRLLQLVYGKHREKFNAWMWESQDGLYNFELAGPEVVAAYMKLIGLEHPVKRQKMKNLLKEHEKFFSATVKARGANYLEDAQRAQILG